MFKFINPEYGFLFIIPITLIIYQIISTKNIKYPGLHRINKSKSGYYKHNIFNSLFIFIFLGILISALMRPVQITGESEVIDIKNFIDIMLLIDFSESMSVKDFEGQSRFETAKKTLEYFISLRKNDRIGLMSFAKGVFVLCPLTFDHKNVKKKLSDLKISYTDKNIIEDKHKGSYIASAIGTAVYHMKKRESKTKIILLLTDGKPEGDNFDIRTVTEIAEKNNIKIYTIAIGNKKNYNIKILEYISKTTKGYFYETDNYYNLTKIMENINLLEKNESVITKKNIYKEFYIYLIELSIIVLIIGLILKYTIFRSIPN